MRRILIFCCLLLAGAWHASALAQSATGIGLRLFQSGLNQPVSVIRTDSEHYYFAELAGRIRVRTPDGVLQAQPALDMSASTFQCSWLGQMQSLAVVTGDEKGLLNIAADQGFSVHRQLYALYTTTSRIVLVRLRASTDFLTLLPASCEVVLMTEANASNHIGGGLSFGPDGLLYIALGEQFSSCSRVVSTGIGCDSSNAGSPSLHPFSKVLWGKILRINPNGTTAAGHALCGLPSNMAASYNAPNDNGFGVPNRCEEIYAYGLRNPWRISVDSQNNNVLIGDVGISGQEELNIATSAGADFGWPCLHGLSIMSGSGSSCAGVTTNSTTTASLLFDRLESTSIVGGVRLRRGDRFNGHYLGTDISKTIHFSPGGITGAINQMQPQWPKTVLRPVELFRAAPLSFPVSITDDRRGNVYLVDLAGSVYQFEFDDTIIFRNNFE
jgi:glucose/arabinose dehydrogenase